MARRAICEVHFGYPRDDEVTHLALLIRPHRGLELVAELVELVGADIADGPEVQAALAPAADVEALDGVGPGAPMSVFAVCATNRLITCWRRW